jgi:ferritin-like metal-binding protein YciE
MANTARDTFIAGLRDAYAMEKQAADMMAGVRDRADAYPELKTRVARHLEETNQQIERLESCLNSIGEAPSTLKELATRTVGAVQNLVTWMTSDAVIKDSIAGYAFEHFEIASYRHLIAMAEVLGETRIADACRTSLAEEEEMARWLDQHMDETARRFMQRGGPAPSAA